MPAWGEGRRGEHPCRGWNPQPPQIKDLAQPFCLYPLSPQALGLGWCRGAGVARRMSPQESSVHPFQFLLLVGIPVASAFLLVQCLRRHCSRWLPGACQKPDDQEETVSPPTPSPEYELSRQSPPSTLPEVAAFYQELHTPTRGQTITRQLMHKLLVYSAREVDHRGGCLMLHDTGISLLIPPGNHSQHPSWQSSSGSQGGYPI